MERVCLPLQYCFTHGLDLPSSARFNKWALSNSGPSYASLNYKFNLNKPEAKAAGYHQVQCTLSSTCFLQLPHSANFYALILFAVALLPPLVPFLPRFPSLCSRGRFTSEVPTRDVGRPLQQYYILSRGGHRLDPTSRTSLNDSLVSWLKVVITVTGNTTSLAGHAAAPVYLTLACRLPGARNKEL